MERLKLRSLEIPCRTQKEYDTLREQKLPESVTKPLMSDWPELPAVPIYDGREIVGVAAFAGWYPAQLSASRLDADGGPLRIKAHIGANVYLPEKEQRQVRLNDGGFLELAEVA
jgi:hypothetical protein